MPPRLSPTIIQNRSLLQPTSSPRQPCLLHQITRSSLLPLLHHPHPPPFSTSTPRLGRVGNNHRGKRTFETQSSPALSDSITTKASYSNPAGGSPALDPLDFSLLDAAYERLVTQLKTDLGKLKPGGLDLDAVEAVKVDLDRGSKGPPVTWEKSKRAVEKREKEKKEREKGDKVRVGDLAQVLIRGRICVVLVGEKEHVKPLLSALQSSLSLPAPPTNTPSAALEIHIPIPPTTGESRAEAQLAAKQVGDKALEKWSEARSAERKRLRALDLGHSRGGPKFARETMGKGEARLTKMYEKVLVEIKTLVENTKQRLGGWNG